MIGRLLLAATAFFGLASASITDCSNGASVLKFTELGLEPAAPSPGDNVVMTVKFNNPGPEIMDGTVSTSISVN